MVSNSVGEGRKAGAAVLHSEQRIPSPSFSATPNVFLDISNRAFLGVFVSDVFELSV